MVGTIVAADREVAEYMTQYLWDQVDEKELAGMIENTFGVQLIKENMISEHIKIIQHLRDGGYTIQKPVLEELS